MIRFRNSGRLQALGMLIVLTTAISHGQTNEQAERKPAWTNRAGQVLQAELVSIDSGSVCFRQPQNRIVKVPLDVFSPDEQTRMHRVLGQARCPDGLREQLSFARRKMRRARLLEDRGVLSPAELEQELETTRALLTEFIRNRFPDTPQWERDTWLTSL